MSAAGQVLGAAAPEPAATADRVWASVPAVRLRGGERELTIYFAPTGVVTIERSRDGRPCGIVDGSIDWLIDRLF